MAESVRRTTEGFRRLIAFSDAVVAIALTLLILPLTDVAGEIRDKTSMSAVFEEYAGAVVSFLISFIVIWVLWKHHHRVMEHLRSYDEMLFRLHFVWLLTIVVLPFATAMIDSNDLVKYGNVFYIGVLAVSISTLLIMERWVLGHPDLLAEDAAAEYRQWMSGRNGYGTVAMLILALVIAVLIPAAGNWPLFVLLLSGPVERLLSKLMPYRGDADEVTAEQPD
ncbi:TMEM175 family protein [Gordonia insulae]|uniref:Potassium channel n=1 Tax=Gordonia insulae TaxID=2420509 RepID=A0A3G8JN13_9ACTN|nr:TMEM175 family protein [Gordonia insulae]AZG45849.1 hypothetical protein D7316_02449 [Gordonia insulae]